MATRSVKARVEIDGEAKYKQALSELNKGNAVLASEMRKLQAQFRGNEESTEALTAKGELLERQLLQQKDKVETLRTALERAAAEYGEADQRTQDWIIKLNNAEAAQFDLERSIEENNQALQNQGEEIVGLGDGLDDLTGKLGIDIPDAAKEALNGIGNFSAGTVAKLGIAAAAVAALIGAMKKLQGLTLESAARVDEILTESMTTGLSPQKIQELQYAENLIDVSTGTIAGSLSKLTRSMYDAQQGNESAAQSFAALGVSITDADGQLRSAESVFDDVIDALGAQENSTERDAMAMELLGKSAQDLNPLILQGSQALRQYAAEAEAMGYVLDESQLQKLGEVDDAYQRLQLTVEGFQNQLASEFAPGSAAAMETFAKAVAEAGEALAKSGIIAGLGEIFQTVAGLIEPLTSLVNDLIPGLPQELQPLYLVLHQIATTIALITDAANVLIGLSTWYTSSGRNRIATGLGLNAQYGQYSNLQQINGIADKWEALNSTNVYDEATGRYIGNGPGLNASGNANWRGGLTYLGENGPEAAILPSGTRILSAQDTAALGGDTFNFTIDVRSLEDLEALIRWAKGVRVQERMR